MSTTSTLPRVRPLPQRTLEALQDGWRAWRAAAERRAQQRRAAREAQAVRDMDELLLRDIGAPDWMVAEAAERRLDRLHGLK